MTKNEAQLYREPRKEKCSGCRLCEMVCSLFHLGIINTEKSAIRIQKDDLNTSLNVPILCNQCKEMKCLEGEKAMEGLEKSAPQLKKPTWRIPWPWSPGSR